MQVRRVVFLGFLAHDWCVWLCGDLLLWAIKRNRLAVIFPRHLFRCQSPVFGPVVSVLVLVCPQCRLYNQCSISLSGCGVHRSIFRGFFWQFSGAVQKDVCSSRRFPTMVYWKNWIRLRDAKKHTIKAFWWFKGDLISKWIPKFYLCDESNPINPQCGKISANFFISPPHPPHPQFYPQKWWKFRYTSWLTKKMHLNRPARCAGQ